MKKWIAIAFITVAVIGLLISPQFISQTFAISISERPVTQGGSGLNFLPIVVREEYTPPPTATPPPTPPVPGDGIVVNHHSIALFEQIPAHYLQAAREIDMMFSDRSVGANISQALDCLTASSWASAPSSCRRDYYDANWNWRTFNQTDLASGNVPARIYFDPSPTTYNRDNWTFEFRQGTWSNLTQNFIEELAPAYLSSKDVLTYQFSYLNVDENGDISDPNEGFFANNSNKYDVYDLEAFIGQHSDKIFIFWTTSLARGLGSYNATNFNNQMRQYAYDNDKILFDVADIQAHTDEGTPCFDNRDGVQYCSQSGNCENYPDDGVNLPAICQDYTTEVDGGHLGSVSAGGIQIAKGYWVLMAMIAGWDGQTP